MSSAPQPKNGHDHPVEIPGAGRMALEALVLLGLLLTISGNVRFVSAFMHTTAAMILLLSLAAGMEAFACKRAGRFRQPGHSWLERSLAGQALLLPALFIAALLLPTAKASILAISVCICVLGIWRAAVPLLRRDEQNRFFAHARQREKTLAHLGVEDIAPATRSETIMAASTAMNFLETLARRAGRAIVLLMLGLSVATGVEAAQTGDWRAPSVPVHKAGQLKKLRPRAKRGARTYKGHRTQGNNSGEATKGEASESSVICSEITTAPSVSTVTIREIEGLFRLAGSGGAIGCPRTVNAEETSEGPIYWSLSWQTGQPYATAIAVIAPQERRFVALAPAVAPVQELVRAHRPIGAEREFARYYAGLGCFYVILSQTGSTLVTEENLQPGEPTVVSPPAVATAIRSADKQYKHWLWPSSPVAHGPDEMLYVLKKSAASPPIDTIHYDPSDHTAWRGPHNNPIRYSAEQENLVIWELRTWIPEAPPHEIQLEMEIERDEG